MINVLFPMGGKSTFFDTTEYPFPKPIIEISGKTMIQMVVDNIEKIESEKQYIFVINEIDCVKYHLDSVLQLITSNSSHIIKLTGETKGATCSALMAIDHINNETPLIIANSDQVIEEDLNKALLYFQNNNADAGVICFDSVHPRWSYVQIDEKNKVIETAEKRPLSKHAIAGFYYFKHGSDFVESAMKSILKDSNVNGLYYTSPTLNELILQGKSIKMYKIKNENYHTFYSPLKIKEYEKRTNKSLKQTISFQETCQQW